MDDIAGRTVDEAAEEPLPFVPEKRTAPHQAHVPRRSNPGLPIPVSDATIPFSGAMAQVNVRRFESDAATRETGPALDSVAETIVPPEPLPEPKSSPGRRIARANPATERAVAVRVDAVTPQALERPRVPVETQPEALLSAKKDPFIGTKLGEYVVEERLGYGGMGIVYRAVQPLIGNSVAIKVLRPDVIADEAEMQRFLGEARAVNSIRHRCIISIFGAGETPDGRKYLVMEYLDGESLEARLQREGRLSTADALPILEEVLSALVAAHAANVVHRDLKPANVFLVRQSEGAPWVKLLDFGLARGANRQDVSRIAGTPDYISPEHARGKPAGPASDLYAFGVLGFHLLTGRLPFVGNTPIEVMEQHVHSAPPVPHEVDDSIPLAMSHLILRLLDKEPANRPDAKTVKADMKAAMKELRSARTMIGVRPVGPIPLDETLQGTRATQAATAISEAPDPKLARRAMQADRARASPSWLGKHWPWVAGAVALAWLLAVAWYLLTRPGALPDTSNRPIVPRSNLGGAIQGPTEPPDTTGVADPGGEPQATNPEPSPVQEPASPDPKKPAGDGAGSERKPKRNTRGK